MKLSFRRSGGFAPIFQGCRFDSDTNPEDPDLLQIKALVVSSGIMSEGSKQHPSARDVYLYTFDIDLDGKHHKVTFDQLSVPPKVTPLLEFLLARSKNMLPE